MIIQELHHIQDEHGYLKREEMLALVKRLNAGEPDHRKQTKLYQLHQVASFFPHFRLEQPPPADVRVCRDMACFMQGGPECRTRLEALAREIGGNQVMVGGVSCLGQCDKPPAVVINGHVYRGKTMDELRSLVQSAVRGEALPEQKADKTPLGWKIDSYNGQPKYDHVRSFIEQWKAEPETDLIKKREKISEPILKELQTATLRGMGGAAFPAFIKWKTVRDCRGDEKYTICNGDESEPGTFKDRELLRRAPHLVVEGITLAGLVTGATRGWIYIRHEYQEEIAAVREAIAAARELGASGSRIFGSELSHELDVFVSPGGYICGEETALLEAMEDRRAEPRNKPPLSVFEGYKGKPTVVNNVETYSWVPAILQHRAEWYRDQGTHGATGLRCVSISGDVAKPGAYEVPFGQTVRELVFGADTAGGMVDGRSLKAIATSGPSSGFLPAQCKVDALPKKLVEALVARGALAAGATDFDLLELPLDNELLKPFFPDYMLGAAFVVYDERRNMFEQAVNSTEFYRNESCGKCVPCRVGSQKLAQMLRQVADRQAHFNEALVKDLCNVLFEASICGLGQVVPSGIRSVLKFFPADLQAYAADSPAA